MTAQTSPALTLATVVVVASLVQLAAPFRFQFGIPGLQADFSANFGNNFGNAYSSWGTIGGSNTSSMSSSSASSSSASSSSSSSASSGTSNPTRGWWPWSQGATTSSARRQPVPTATMGDVGLLTNAVNKPTASKDSKQAAGGFGLWDSYGVPFAGGTGSMGVRGGAGAASAASAANAEDGVVFNLFTRKNPRPVRLYARDMSTVKSSTFNPKRKTKMVIHGFNGNTKEGSAGDLVKDVYLRMADVNVILVDWNDVDQHFYLLDVSTVVPAVGGVVAGLIRALVEQAGADLNDFHLIGHSLGAHIAGAAGSATLGPAGKGAITGLDAAGPLYEGAEEARRLDASDAGFVEAVHTDGGYLGIVQPVGHVDWFINTGLHRHPDCGADILGICTHCFAFEVFTHALANKNTLVGTKCDSLDKYQSGGCQGNPRLAMNVGVRHRARGSFYVDTKLRPSEGLRGVGSRLITPIISQISRYIIPRSSNDPAVRC